MKRLGDALGAPEQPDTAVSCRRCGKTTPMSGTAVWLARTFSTMLERRGEKKLQVNEVMYCRPCGAEAEDRWLQQMRVEDEIAEAIVRKSVGASRLEAADRRWLEQHGRKDSAASVDRQVEAAARPARTSRKDSGTGFR